MRLRCDCDACLPLRLPIELTPQRRRLRSLLMPDLEGSMLLLLNTQYCLCGGSRSRLAETALCLIDWPEIHALKCCCCCCS